MRAPSGQSRSLPPIGSVISYAIGAAVVGACALLKVLLDGAVGAPLPPFITFYPAVVIVSLVAGDLRRHNRLLV
jgi:hypothetical protein